MEPARVIGGIIARRRISTAPELWTASAGSLAHVLYSRPWFLKRLGRWDRARFRLAGARRTCRTGWDMGAFEYRQAEESRRDSARLPLAATARPLLTMPSPHPVPSVFLGYSYRDELWKDRLKAHLGALEPERLLDVWE